MAPDDITEDRLVEQRVRLYESQLRHIDELKAQAARHSGHASAGADLDQAVTALERERERLTRHIDMLKSRSREDWQEADALQNRGPMLLYQSVAKRLEQLLQQLEPESAKTERHGRKP